MKLLAALIYGFALVATYSACSNKEFDQCGGDGFKGETCCPDYDKCVLVNQYYSQCQAKDLCLNPMYGQCGGMDHHQPPRPWTPENHHQTCCPPSFSCTYKSEYYSQCIYNSTNHTCAEAYGQCGGQGWKGKTCCIPGFKCTKDPKNPKYYSGCEPLPICSNARYGQCGGIDADGNPWTKEFGHDSCCPDAFSCSYVSEYYSQCKKNDTAVALDAIRGA